MLNWVQQFNIFCLLDNQQYALAPHHFEYLVGAGAEASVDGTRDAFEAIDIFLGQGGWTFGHLSYEAGYAFQGLEITKPCPIAFPPFLFFRPQVVLFIKDGQLHIEGENEEAIYQQVIASGAGPAVAPTGQQMQSRLTREEYLGKITSLQDHIRRGDCYEINFCQEFFAHGVTWDPAAAFHALNSVSPNPFAAFYKYHDQYLVCASPERFLTRAGNTLLSQPMKGTAVRAQDRVDESGATRLQESAKDRAENVMIVDLVRNDLSVVCTSGSVQVEQLFEVLTFPSVYQMISAVTGEVDKGVSFTEIIEATFPMGSMTGAPKKRVMQLIDRYESGSRGIFSGCVGYIAPGGDFDFNVVIRSIMYNGATGYLSYQVGSGITAYSEPEREWEECLLKGAAIKKVLTGN